MTWTPKPQPGSTTLWFIENEHGHVVQDALSERFAKQVCEMRWTLGQIIADLPSNRDWLDPDLECFARKALNPPK